MGNRIDLSDNLRTDLAIESINNKKKIISNKIDNIVVEKIKISSGEEKRIQKKAGNYITISFEDVTNFEEREKVGKVLETEIKKLLEQLNIKPDAKCLIVGLGNEKSTADSLGPYSASKIIVTRHLFELGYDIQEGMRNISVIIPGVTSTTGIETSNYIEAITKIVKPDFVIIIDSLASLSIERINKTLQMTDTGIHPGSGVGNSRKEISSKTLNIPVIAIGMPTVVSSAVIVSDTINYLCNHIAYLKDNYDESKLVFNHSLNYIEKIKKTKLSQKEQEYILGIIGTLNNQDKTNLINEVLSSINYNLIVTPTEIDYIIHLVADIISSSLNNALNRQITHY